MCCLEPLPALGALGAREHKIKTILLQLDTDRLPGVFDTVMAHDAGVDCVLPFGGVSPQQARDLVREIMFARTGEALQSLAIFIGGSNLAAGQDVLAAVQSAFFDQMRVSVMLDSNGCNTTAAAVVAKVRSAGEIAGKKAVVLAGTGPVGQRTAALVAREKAAFARVTITSRQLRHAQHACMDIEKRFGVPVRPAEAKDAEGVRRALEGAEIVITTGTPGVMILPEAAWRGHPTIRVLADVNAVPPLGIEGIEASWDGEQRHGKIIFGALAIGGLKKETQYACLARLFERNDLVLDAEQISAVAQEIERARLRGLEPGRGPMPPCAS